MVVVGTEKEIIPKINSCMHKQTRDNGPIEHSSVLHNRRLNALCVNHTLTPSVHESNESCFNSTKCLKQRIYLSLIREAADK